MLPAFQLGLLVPLTEEFLYISELCSVVQTIPVAGERYLDIALSEERHIVCQVLGEMGIASTALAAERMVEAFDLSALAIVGIAGALDKDLRLGDVVVASEIDHYLASAKAVKAGRGYAFQPAGKVWQTAHTVVSGAQAFAYAPETEISRQRWAAECAAHRPPEHASSPVQLSRPSPKYEVGPVASGDIVGAATEFAAWIRTRNRRLLALEMEAAGAALVAHAREQPFKLLVLRGISDFADERKAQMDQVKLSLDSDAGTWRRYATQNAFRLLSALLEAGIFATLEARPKD